ncbi:hypothetical protein B0H17DRAFT_1140033 [Mycena rosella]|uniref:Uncharacterized protein n=1 Tax=Mycena rosella TaxID=1033263 RepID=A0AAD7D2Q0_MYCRO|nr:hypothetical protein B0H17DRAFT_1140033 [Mycena rosella]
MSHSLSKTNCLTITLIYYGEYDQGIEISSENCGSPTANVATTVLCTIYDQNTHKVMPSESHMVTALTTCSHILPSLRSLLTNLSIIKVGYSIRQTLQTISTVFSIPEIEEALKIKSPPILDMGKYAKLKGVVDEPSVLLHALAGAVLKKNFSIPAPCKYPWALTLGAKVKAPERQAKTHGQLVTLVQGCKPIAEGSIIGHHSGYLDTTMDDIGQTKRINVSASRSLVEIFG